MCITTTLLEMKAEDWVHRMGKFVLEVRKWTSTSLP